MENEAGAQVNRCLKLHGLSGVAALGIVSATKGDCVIMVESATVWAYVMPLLMLVASNVFMTFAWYGHLQFKHSPLMLAILVSWGIALFEYCLAVPANRFGSSVYSTAQLKTMQEVITLCVFAVFSVTYLGEALAWRHAVGFALIGIGATFIFYGKV